MCSASERELTAAGLKPRSTYVVDVAIVGSGFAGSLLARILRAQGRSVALLERGRHPRFAIGESSTPLANLLIEELCDRYGLDRVRPLSKWGTWRARYPGVTCGLKRGFSFFRHEAGRAFEDDERHARQLLVAASPHDDVGDTHWLRADVDHFLVREAQDAGVEYVDEVELTSLRIEPSGVVLEGSRSGSPVRVHGAVVVDASGPRGFLHAMLGLAEAPLRWLPPTQGLYTHFEHVARFEATPNAGFDAGTPYRVDEAAVHHVFDGGWIWVLRFGNGITSAGAALTDDLARQVRLGEADGWGRLIGRLPSVAAQFASARPVRPFVYAPRLGFRSASVAGDRWVLLPSAAGVIDPLLSTGFPLTLLGIQRLAAAFEDTPPGAAPSRAALAAYEAQTLRELDVTERLVGTLYSCMHDFERFKRVSLLYFAAASYSETVRRLGRPERARGFLLCDDPVFAAELDACTSLARSPDVSCDALRARIDRAIAPIDVAGLRDAARRDWYPVNADDLLNASALVGATTTEIETLLERCGFEPVRGAGLQPCKGT